MVGLDRRHLEPCCSWATALASTMEEEIRPADEAAHITTQEFVDLEALCNFLMHDDNQTSYEHGCAFALKNSALISTRRIPFSVCLSMTPVRMCIMQ